MPLKRLSITEYEELSGLQRGQLWECLTPEEQERLKQLGYRRKCKLTRGAIMYLLEVFPLPGHDTELVSMSNYELQAGFGVGDLLHLLSEEQKERLHQLGYRKYRILPYRAMLYLQSLGFY